MIQDADSHVGFPGFDGMAASVSLAYVAAMQEHGIPITFAYISDAHDNHGTSGNIHVAYGPGEAGYVARLKAYDRAFGKFFDRLAADGITKDNALFVITVEEGDHFVGSQPSPAGCDGVMTPCTYSQIGEINTNLAGLLATQKGNTTPFPVHSDVAPTVYVTGNPGRTESAVRQLERDAATLTATNPYTGASEQVTAALADPVRWRRCTWSHPIRRGHRPSRSSAIRATSSSPEHGTATHPASSCRRRRTRPSRGITAASRTRSRRRGPGTWRRESASWERSAESGAATRTFGPTILTLLGLQDDYKHDGRTVIEPLFDWAVPQSLRAHRATLVLLGASYKQLTAPFGEFGMDTLKASTAALKNGSSGDDSRYTSVESRIESLTNDRNEVAREIRDALDAAEFQGKALNQQQALRLIARASVLIVRAKALAVSG